MYVRPVRRKKINLWLLILIVLFIVAIVFTIIHMSNSSKANSDNRYNKQGSENTINRESSGSTIGKVDSYDSFSNIAIIPKDSSKVEMYNEVPNETPAEVPVTIPGMVSPSSPGAGPSSPITLDNHTYSFGELGESSLEEDGANKYITLKKEKILYKIKTEKTTFNDTLNKDGLKAYIESTYGITITSEIKTGTINNVQMIICSMADKSSVGYFIMTPLNDSELLCLKVFDANNQFALIQDLSEPINDIDSIKTNIQ